MIRAASDDRQQGHRATGETRTDNMLPVRYTRTASRRGQGCMGEHGMLHTARLTTGTWTPATEKDRYRQYAEGMLRHIACWKE
jgi:hypothetical protein